MAIEFRPSSAPKRKELPAEDRSGPQCPSPSLPDTLAGNTGGHNRSAATGKDQYGAPQESQGVTRVDKRDVSDCVTVKVVAGNQALPVDTNSRAQFDRLKYQREYMRDRNTIKRLGLNMTVGEWRKSKGLV